MLLCRYLNVTRVRFHGIFFNPNSYRILFSLIQIYCDCRKNKSFRPRDKGKKGLKNLQSVKTLAGRTQSYTATLCSKARKQPLTVSAQFQLSLHSLMETLNQANPFFIRCIKSNSEKVSSTFYNSSEKEFVSNDFPFVDGDRGENISGTKFIRWRDGSEAAKIYGNVGNCENSSSWIQCSSFLRRIYSPVSNFTAKGTTEVMWFSCWCWFYSLFCIVKF